MGDAGEVAPLSTQLAQALGIDAGKVGSFLVESRDNGRLVTVLFAPSPRRLGKARADGERAVESGRELAVAESPDGGGKKAGEGKVKEQEDDGYGSGFASSSDEEEGGDDASVSTCSSASSLDVSCLKTGSHRNESGRQAYLDACKSLKVHPISYFVENLERDHVSLAQHQINLRGIQALCQGLAVNEFVKSLDLTNCAIKCDGIAALCQLLESNTMIEAVTLSENQLDFGSANLLGDALACRNNQVRSVVFRNTKIGNRWMRHFAHCINRDDALCKLTKLDLADNQIGEAGIAALAPFVTKQYTLINLNLGWNNAGGKGGATLLNAVATAPYSNLAKLNLSWNGLTDVIAEPLAEVLKTSKTIAVLDLSHNRITEPTASKVAATLSLSSSLRTLQIGFNDLGLQATQAVIRSLEHNSSIRFLGIENSLCLPSAHQSTDEAVATLQRLVQQVKAKRFVFAQVHFLFPHQ